MARPAKPAGTGSGAMKKETLQARMDAERQLRGAAISLKPPSYLSADQKKVYKTIVGMLEAAGTLGEADTYILEQTVIAIDRLKMLNLMQNAHAESITDKDVISAVKAQTSIFFRGCNELGLSPQARAKLGIIAANAKEQEEPLAGLMGADT